MDGDRAQEKDLLLPLCFSTHSLELLSLCGGPRDAFPDLLNFKVATELTFSLFVWKTFSLLPFLFVSKQSSWQKFIRWLRDKDIKYDDFQLQPGEGEGSRECTEG